MDGNCGLCAAFRPLRKEVAGYAALPCGGAAMGGVVVAAPGRVADGNRLKPVFFGQKATLNVVNTLWRGKGII